MPDGSLAHAHPIADLPALAAGCVVMFYWFCVLRMAYRQRRRTGRGANFVPRERTGRLVRVVWLPVVVIWVGSPLAVALDAPRHGVLKLMYGAWPLRMGAAAGALAALVATLRCWRHMGRAWRMGIDPAERTPLIVTGPFARVRHPIYTLSALLMLCTLAAAPTALLAGAAVVHLGLLGWEAMREERHLARLHGEAFERYRSAVGAFLPSFARSDSVNATAA